VELRANHANNYGKLEDKKYGRRNE